MKLSNNSGNPSHSSSRIAFSEARNSRSMAFNILRCAIAAADLLPCFKAFCDDLALPSGVFTPASFHGCHCLIIIACFARRSGVHPFAIMSLQ